MTALGAKLCGEEKAGVAIDGDADGIPEPVAEDEAPPRLPDWNAKQGELTNSKSPKINPNLNSTLIKTTLVALLLLENKILLLSTLPRSFAQFFRTSRASDFWLEFVQLVCLNHFAGWRVL